ncbi:MAG: hypothetical protein ACK4SU_06595, partial [Dictyoglomus sp.]
NLRNLRSVIYISMLDEEDLNPMKEKGIIIISTDKIVFEVSGILYSHGIKGAVMKSKLKEEDKNS